MSWPTDGAWVHSAQPRPPTATGAAHPPAEFSSPAGRTFRLHGGRACSVPSAWSAAHGRLPSGCPPQSQPLAPVGRAPVLGLEQLLWLLPPLWGPLPLDGKCQGRHLACCVLGVLTEPRVAGWGAPGWMGWGPSLFGGCNLPNLAGGGRLGWGWGSGRSSGRRWAPEGR